MRKGRQSFSQIAFAFKVMPGLLARGIVWAALIGLIGGLFPAILIVSGLSTRS